MAELRSDLSTFSVGVQDTLGQSPAGFAQEAEALLREVAERRLFGDEPLRIGRYRIVGVLGHGGMGTVLDGRDDELDRAVALKVVHARAGEAGDRNAKSVLNEARALAAISHPNIVEVFEVGIDQRGVFIAMERVQGPTLETWLRSRRTWREVLPILLQAAQGLAAAHAQRQIHGDFKPSNVMVGDDGRVRVVDFGLARAATGAPGDRTPDQVYGTPAYMAPEQFSGAPSCSLTDQFSFCVVLCEALYGARPYRNTSQRLPERVRVPSRSGVPRWIRRVVETGLRREPGERHASMAALLTAFSRRRWSAAATVGIVAVAGVGMYVLGVGAPTEPQCPSAQERAEQLLTPGSRAAMRDAFAATQRVHAAQSLETVEAALEHRVQRWAEADVVRCETSLANPDGSRGSDRAVGCLADRRRRIWAVIETLSVADAQTVDHAVELVSDLRSVESCTERGTRSGPLAVPPEQQAAAVDLRERLALAEALGTTGKLKLAVERIAPLLAEAEALGARALLAEVRASYGKALASAGDRSGAVEALEAAFLEATAADDDQTAAFASLTLTGVYGGWGEQPEAVQHWQRQAETTLVRLGNPQREYAMYLSLSAGLAEQRGDYPEALAFAKQAVELSEQGSEDGGVQLAVSLKVLGLALYRAGQYDEASEVLARASQTMRHVFGEHHPALGRNLLVSAAVAESRSRLDDALSMAREAVDILDETFGPNGAQTLNARAQLAGVLVKAGDADQAIVLLQETLQRAEEILGTEHPVYESLLTVLGSAQVTLGRNSAARTTLAKTVELARLLHGPTHPQLATALSHFGETQRELGEFEGAGVTHREALRIREHNGSPMRIAASLEALARLAEDEGHLREAVALYEQATEKWTEAYGAEDDNVIQTQRLGQAIEARLADSRSQPVGKPGAADREGSLAPP